MATSTLELPKLPTKPKDFLGLLSGKDHKAVETVVQPFIEHENALRQVFAQQRDHPAVKGNGLVNCVPLFDGFEAELTIRARDITSESEEQQSKYIMPLQKGVRKANGALATAASLDEFKYNFGLFSENCLAGLDWSNIVAAGSSVLTPLLAIPDKYKCSKRSMRQYYHQEFTPASDIDLFIYGLTEDEALKKMQTVEQTIRDNILLDTITIRTRYAVTIASKHPNRHVQIVLRLYDSISELITGFDVDASAVAYDGQQVWASPRAVAAIITQVNKLDINRRSPSYENRLAKYAQRGFEVHWPALERSKIDPTIFERHFPRTNGLARLLVLEKLPKAETRDNYRSQRRSERGRPSRHEPHASGRRGKLNGNLKDQQPEDIADWTFEDDYSSYHSFTVPYGPKFDAKRIEKLMYTRDLLLNAEWNKPKDRKVNLHRHPCFIGNMEEVQEDCCGFCPEPLNREDREVEEEEHKNYVFNKLTFLKDNPGRQEIGSFHPLTDDDFTLMAYIGNTAELCTAIVDKDLEKVKEWCNRPGADVNVRDHTGRTPLHLATLTSSPEIVQYLIDHGARIVARLVDGMTALHLAAARGNSAMVSALLRKSEDNEELEDEKETRRIKAKEMLMELGISGKSKPGESDKFDDESETDSTEESEDYEESDVEDDETQGSFVKIKKEKEASDPLEENEDEPDVYDVNLLAWDVNMSPLHLAIICGHPHIVELLVKDFGADPLLPFLPSDGHNNDSKNAIMSLTLATTLPLPEAKEMILTLLKNGCTSAQADPMMMSAFHSLVKKGNLELVKLLCDNDAPHPTSVINNLARTNANQYVNEPPHTPLTTAIKAKNVPLTLFLVDQAEVTIKYETFVQWLKKAQDQSYYHFRFKSAEQNELSWKYRFEQPIEMALRLEELELVKHLIPKVDLNKAVVDSTLSSWSEISEDNVKHRTILDEVISQLEKLHAYEKPEKKKSDPPDNTVLKEADYLTGIATQSYTERYTRHKVILENKARERRRKEEEEKEKNPPPKVTDGEEEKYAAVQAIIKEYENIRELLISHGAKTGKDLGWKAVETPDNNQRYNSYYPSHRLEQPVKPFDPKIKFDIGDITEASRGGYIQLFEAAWEGDIEKINELTTGFWGDQNPPLEIAVKDSIGWSPFFIACVRGHLRLAKHIVEIARMQHHPMEEKFRYEIGNDYEYDDCYSSYDSDSENDNEPNVRKRVIENVEMIENVATIHNSVNSKVKPLTMLIWSSAVICTTLDGPLDITIEDDSIDSCSALDYAALYNNQKLFKFLLQLLKSVVSKTPINLDLYQEDKLAFVPGVFAVASKYDRVDMLKEVISTFGYGIEIESDEGATPAEQSKFYKGLTIGGKKRADWVKSGRGRHSRYDIVKASDSLALNAIRQGGYKSAAFLFGDGPQKSFDEFKAANPEDVRSLAAENKEKPLTTFWGTNEHLTLHAVALGFKYDDKAAEFVRTVVSERPELLDSKSANGFTPLLVAIAKGPPQLSRLLLSLGANPKIRDAESRSLAHFLLIDPDGLVHHPHGEDHQELFDLIDPEVLHELFLSRSSSERCVNGSKTPLGQYLDSHHRNHQYQIMNAEYLPAIRRTLRASKGDDLKIPNDHGDYPLHTAVKRGLVKTTQLFIEKCPEMLHRENANGQTPLDIVNNTRFLETKSKIGSENDNGSHYGRSLFGSRHQSTGSVLTRSAETFATREDLKFRETDEIVDGSKVYDIIQAVVKEHPGPRKLVSLFEANALAERLAKPFLSEGQPPRLNHTSGYVNHDHMPKNGDEVFRWWNTSGRLLNKQRFYG